jgi:hypothetical protein
LKGKLGAIDSKRKDGKFIAHDGSVPAGQAELMESLEQCYQIIREMEVGIPAIERELNDIKKSLLKLEHTALPSHNDLQPLQERLQQIESQRGDGKFLDDNGAIPAGQAKLVDLLEECHAIKQKIVNKIH